jgi:tRNA dimethylallyltransferase
LREIAIIGATASGKSAKALQMAEEQDGYILSIDSLSIYREIDILSAKPLKEELERVRHFGVDEIFPNEEFNVNIFIQLYNRAKERAVESDKDLFIVGGTSFYLKTLLTGLSTIPEISEDVQGRTKELLENPQDAWKFLNSRDNLWASRVKSSDRYRLEKALHILFETGKTPSIWFEQNPPQPIISNQIEIWNIDIERQLLRDRILKRTESMLEMGLIDEVKYLLSKYGRDINPAKAIGFKETIDFLDGNISTTEELVQLISTHTAQLAKRQTTFNRTQFRDFNIKSID